MPVLDLDKPPLRIAYDIVRMSAGGANGGIKTHHYEFLRWLAGHRRLEFSLLVFCQAELIPELGFLAESPFAEIHAFGPKPPLELRDLGAASRLPTLHFWGEAPPERLLAKLRADLLYCGFGSSQLEDESIPQISLLVDCLHRDEPEFLPPAERERRDALYCHACQRAELVQTNSQFCADSLVRHFDIDPARILRIYLPLLDRFNRVEMAPPGEDIPNRPFFFYPANHWPHKNHEALLAAYGIYRSSAGAKAWDLVLTGASTERTAFLRETCEALGLQERVRFLGHLPLPALKTAWELSGALVFPSLYEGFGLPVLEAMHFQKPIVAGRLASIPEICGDDAVYCDPRDPADLARAMSEVASRPDTRQRYDERLRRFQIDAEGARLAEAMERLAGRPTASA